MVLKKIKFLTVILTFGFINFAYAGFSEATTAAQLYDEACPTSWKDLKKTLPANGSNPSFTGNPPWAAVPDRPNFETYLRSFIVTKTLTTSSPQALSADKLTVASQCIMRRNAVVDAHFGRNTNSGMPERISLDAIMLIINQYMNDD